MAIDDEKTNPGKEIKNGGPRSEEDHEKEAFQKHVRRSSMASIPELPEDMLPWLVGRVAANEVAEKAYRAQTDAKLDAIEALVTETNRRAPTLKEKYGIATLVAFLAAHVIARYLGIDIGPLMNGAL